MEKRTILWVDDDMDDLELMHDVLKESDYNFLVQEAHNGREALDYLRQSKKKNNLPCLIILDMNMPVMDGREALKRIKEDVVLREIPAVVFTTSQSEMDKAYCKRYGVEMITKPLDYSSLERIVGQLLSYAGLDCS
jgi:CheY-like chemotaxis protein